MRALRTLKTHYSHRGRGRHRLSALSRFSIYVITPLLIAFLGVSAAEGSLGHIFGSFDLSMLLSALGVSFVRLIVAYVVSLVAGILLAIWATSSRRAEAVLLPLFDVLESVPVLVFFPVIIVLFVRYQFFDAAAVVILALNMIWNIVFNVVGGIKVIPQDVKIVPRIFGLSAARRLFAVTLPAVIPSLITGSLLAWAEGWNMLIVAEVLRNYAPQTAGAGDLFGIGSVLVNATANGETSVFFGAVVIIVLSVIVINIFVWQPLLRYSEKFAFDA